MVKTEAQTIAEMLDLSRQLTLYYLKKLENEDPYKVFEIDGKQLNNIVWLMAHIATSENWLVFVCTGEQHVKIPWARQFGMGSEIPKKEDCPPIDEVRAIMDEVHEKAMQYIPTLSDEKLNEPTANGISFGGEDSVRAILKHCIRHESSHSGQLGWLCKLFGVQTI